MQVGFKGFQVRPETKRVDQSTLLFGRLFSSTTGHTFGLGANILNMTHGSDCSQHVLNSGTQTHNNASVVEMSSILGAKRKVTERRNQNDRATWTER